jgi:hypothetical protein
VADYFLVERAKGAAWDHGKPRLEQAGWDAHAAFMDALATVSVRPWSVWVRAEVQP